MSTPYKHAVSSAQKFGGVPSDYVELHDWLDETKQFTGDWTHRALRHHAAGVQWAIEKFGHTIRNIDDKEIPVKVLAETHIMEDCGFIPKVSDWLDSIKDGPKPWMLSVPKTKTIPLG